MWICRPLDLVLIGEGMTKREIGGRPRPLKHCRPAVGQWAAPIDDGTGH